jgi:hypothetical protein
MSEVGDLRLTWKAPGESMDVEPSAFEPFFLASRRWWKRRRGS